MVAALLTLLALPFAPLQRLELPYETFTLDNGLQVVVHEDHSDPVVAVYVLYHVGSGREETGRTGFAHLFEHMLFQGSQHVGDDRHFQLVQEAGGTLNGSTNRDRTNYFEILPANQLELALWLEADRMGFLLPAVTQEKLDNQREVVKNERRQRLDNVPYAKAREVVTRALYPDGHPYQWLTIGSMEDLDAASLEDVHRFFRRWYGPNNATLAVGGDVDPARVRELVERWFGSIPSGPPVPRPEPRPARLALSERLVVEDDVKLAEVALVWPTVPRYHEDEAALDMLARLLSGNRAALLERPLRVDAALASVVDADHDGDELAGEFSIQLRANPGTSLDDLEHRALGILRRLADEGVPADALERAQTAYEGRTLRAYETVGRRTSALAESNVFAGDPGGVTLELERRLTVTPADVQRVLARYLVERPRITCSVVPLGRLELAASGRTLEQVAQETALDRTSQPAAGDAPAVRLPEIWEDAYENGVRVTAARYSDLPLTLITLAVPAGHLYAPEERAGVASLTAELMEQGTARRDVVALTEALDALGASLSVSADDDEILVTLSTLDRHLDAAAALLQEIVLEPRLSEQDFERVRHERLVALEGRVDDPRAIAGDVYRRVVFGDGSDGAPPSGTLQTVGSLTLEDVSAFWRDHVVPDGARLLVVGDHEPEEVRATFASLVERWHTPDRPEAARRPPVVEAPAIEGPRLYLVDKPGAVQSQIRVGHLGPDPTDADFYPATVLNYVLGGAFSSRINMNLREDKGWTYGARSSFDGGLRAATFTASAPVRTDATAASVSEILKELRGIREGVTPEELAFTKDALGKALARRFEGISSQADMLNDISKYGYPADYVRERQATLEGLTEEELQALAQRLVRPEGVAVVVVGDQARIAEDLAALGYGAVVELDAQGDPLED